MYSSLSAQTVDYRIEKIALRGDLSNFDGTCILQDIDGFMWFGSKDGLYRYDGINFKVYRNDPSNSNSLPSNWVNCLLEDNEGTLWIGLWEGGGVYRFDKYTEKFKRYFNEPDNYLTDSWIQYMTEDRKGTIWIATYLGFSSTDKRTKKVKNYKIDLGDTMVSENPPRIWYLFEDSEGYLWVQYGMSGLCRFDTESESFEIIPNTPCELNHIYEDHAGRLWITSWDGLYHFDRKKKIFDRYLHKPDNPNRLNNQMVKPILEDKSNNLWMRTYDGIYQYNQNLELIFHWKHAEVYSPTPIYADMTKSLCRDKSDMIWFFTRDAINKITKTYNNYNVYDPDPSDNSFVNCITLENMELIWFGALNGLYSYSRSTRNFKLHYGIFKDVEAHPYTINAIHPDQKGILWIGTRKGLLKMVRTEEQADKHMEFIPPFIDSTHMDGLPIDHIFEDSEGRLWIGGERQTTRFFDPFEDRFIWLVDNTNKRDSIKIDATIRHETRTGILWGTGETGIYKIFPPFIKVSENAVTAAKILKYNPIGDYYVTRFNRIYDSYLDSTGVIWLATQLNGLIKLTGKNLPGTDQNETIINAYTTNQGLPGNRIASILEDNNGYLWLAGNGLTRFNKSSGSVKNYSLRNLPIGQFLPGSAAKSPDGELFFGTYQGMISFYPDSLFTNQYVAPVKLTGFKVHNKQIIPGDQSILEKSITYTQNVELPYNQNFVTIEFASLNFRESDLNQYKYRLEGLENDWIFSSGWRNLASYSNLRPGKYTFKVLGSNNDGLWNEEGASLGIVIHPPPWFSWWAYVLYGLIVIMIIRWYRNFLITRERLRADLQLERVEVEKVQELERTKSRFFSNISHEFRTPLTLILGPLEKLIGDRPNIKEWDWNVFYTMKSNAIKLKGLINQILDISKLESGQMRLQVSKGNITDFVKNIALSFISLAESKNISYKYKIEGSSELLYFDKDKLDKIACNLIGNAFKFTPDGGKIMVKQKFISKDNNMVPDYFELSVRDTGRGIPKDQFDKIFDRFYQMENQNGKQEGTGLGLALTKELIDLYRGEIKLQSETGMGSVFTVKLPVSSDRFSREEIIETVLDESLETFTERVTILEEEITEDERIDTVKNQQHRPILLIVEDIPDLRKYIIQCLHAGFNIYEAGDGLLGLEKAKELIPDLIISDIMMPGIDGIEMCSRLKTDVATSHVPIIMLTAKGDMGSKIEGLKTGADDYIIKPFDAKELRVRADNLIEQRRKLRERYRKEMVLGAENLALPQPDEKFLTRVNQIVNEHISASEYTVRELSVELGMSRSQLYRKILALTDQSATEFMRNIKLKYAASLFDKGHQNVTEVSLQAGFSSPSYFASCFRKLFGKNPKQYIAG